MIYLGNNYSIILSSTISYYRKVYGLTQEQLAEQLGITSKAISKWENNLNCPDVSLIPQLAKIFNITIDELFGRKYEKEVIYDYVANLNWEDDNKLRIALYSGKKLISHEEHEIREGENIFNYRFFGTPYDISGFCKVKCEKETRSKKFK